MLLKVAALLCQRRRKSSEISIIVIAQTRSYTETHMHQQAILIKKIKGYQHTDNACENSVLGLF